MEGCYREALQRLPRDLSSVFNHSQGNGKELTSLCYRALLFVLVILVSKKFYDLDILLCIIIAHELQAL